MSEEGTDDDWDLASKGTHGVAVLENFVTVFDSNTRLALQMIDVNLPHELLYCGCVAFQQLTFKFEKVEVKITDRPAKHPVSHS
jgi:hypothetical protein